MHMSYQDDIDEANAILMGGERTRSCSFDGKAPITWAGVVISPPKVVEQTDPQTREVKRWPNGDPKKSIVITLQTDVREDDEDDGRRGLWLKFKSQQAVAEAVRAAGVRKIEVGGYLTCTYTHDDVKKPGQLKAVKLYSATYTPPDTGNEALMADPMTALTDAFPGTSAVTTSAATRAPASVAQLAQQQSALLQQMRNRNLAGQPQNAEPPF
jgi:hypothetical protein